MARKPNGFMIFTFEWKAKHGQNLSLSDATTEAGKLWAEMTPEQRSPYNDRTSKNKCDQKQEKRNFGNKPMSNLLQEKELAAAFQRQMLKDIEATVNESVRQGELDTKTYNFIMVNYFTKNLNGQYIPAEIALSSYSLKGGIFRTYHSCISPNADLFGYQYLAQENSKTTHKLPLPPNAMGNTDLFSIYKDVMEFVYDKDSNSYPPLYTERECMPIMVSVLEYLKSSQKHSRSVNLQVYSIQCLFFHMKKATCELGKVDICPKTFYITDAYFERDCFEYESNIGCEYHEEIDRAKYCTQSYVTRWGYMFSDYMCGDIGILVVPGRHVPIQTNLNAVTYSTDKDGTDTTDTESVFSGAVGPRGSAVKSFPVPAHFDDEDFGLNVDGPSSLNRNNRMPQKPDVSYFEITDEMIDENRSYTSMLSGRGRVLSRMCSDLSILSQSFVAGRGRGRGRGQMNFKM